MNTAQSVSIYIGVSKSTVLDEKAPLLTVEATPARTFADVCVWDMRMPVILQ